VGHPWACTENSTKMISREPKVNKVKFFLPFLKLMKCPHTEFHVHAMSNPKLLSQNLSSGQNLWSGQTFFAA